MELAALLRLMGTPSFPEPVLFWLLKKATLVSPLLSSMKLSGLYS